jgi:hypothetical protein
MVRPLSPDQLATATGDHEAAGALGRLDDALFGRRTPRGLEIACIASLFASAALCLAAWLIP